MRTRSSTATTKCSCSRSATRSSCAASGTAAGQASCVPSSRGRPSWWSPARQQRRAEPMRVSVSLLTYNHERYVAQAIESVLAQRGVDFELVVSEDHSTDGTRAIVEEYAARHPDRIRVLPSPQNVGMTRAFARGIEAARGTYVALLDGDDYWTSPDKLRLQTDFLDAHPECAICFHNVTVVYEDGSSEPHPFHSPEPHHYLSRAMPKPVSTLADVAPGNFMQTCSVMFRRGLFGEFPAWFDRLAVADW